MKHLWVALFLVAFIVLIGTALMTRYQYGFTGDPALRLDRWEGRVQVWGHECMHRASRMGPGRDQGPCDQWNPSGRWRDR